MSDTQGLDLSAQFAERLAQRFPTEAPPDTPAPEVEQEAQEQPKGLKAALLAQGLNVEDDLDEEAVAQQAAERIKQSIEKDRELEALRQQTLELQKALEAQQAKPAEQPKDEPKAAAEAAEAIKRWQRVEVDEQLYNLVEQKDGVYVGKPTLGMTGIEAAKTINQAMKERSRRADILTNDPLAALDEAGVISAIEGSLGQRLTNQIKEIEAQLEEKLTRAKREELEAQRKATEEAAAKSFMDERKKDFFKLNDKGDIVLDVVTQQAVLTPEGKRVRELAKEVMDQEGIEDPNKALRLAVRIYDREKAAKQVAPEPKKEDKKQAFLDKGRVQTGHRTNVAVRDDETPVTIGRPRLRDIVAASQQD